MSFLSGIAEWIMSFILKYLLDLAAKKAKEALDQVEQDKKRGEINDANVKAYEEAQDLESRRKAASDLLNRVRP